MDVDNLNPERKEKKQAFQEKHAQKDARRQEDEKEPKKRG